MDILDILMARALNPDAQAETAAKAAKEAALEAKADAETASNVAQTLEDAIERATNIPVINITNQNTNTAVSSTMQVQDNSGISSIMYKNYKQEGENEDGSMTQKAIKTYVQSAIDSIPQGGGQGGGSIDLGDDNAGKIVVVGDDGQPQSGTITEKSIIQALINSGSYVVEGSYGLKINYADKTFARDQDAAHVIDFSNQPIYNKIRRCLVDDNGEIISFYGDGIYEDDPSTGYQTMVYIPKFYYLRIPLEYNGSTLKQEELFISATPQDGFKIHPAFINEDGEEVDYILFSAYESSAYSTSNNSYVLNDSDVDFNTDKLASIAGSKPLSGANKEFNLENAEKMATNRGKGWHVNSFKAISAIQMLAMIEYGSMNMQTAINPGVSELNTGSTSVNSAVITGATSSLGNASGRADTTTNIINGNEYTYTEDGQCSVSYRGIENIWGSMWSIVGGAQVRKSATNNQFYVYVCKNLNYANGVYEPINVSLPLASGWIGNFGYDENFDWAFLPIDASSGNNKLPVGDYYWAPLAGDNVRNMRIGGYWGLKDSDGLFAYAFDHYYTSHRNNSNGRLMFVPIKNQIYYSNLQE